eukprot:2546700-Pleurochrysis_carterae.AAC.1
MRADGARARHLCVGAQPLPVRARVKKKQRVLFCSTAAAEHANTRRRVFPALASNCHRESLQT